MRDVVASLREFCGKIIRHWFAVVVGVIGGSLGVATSLVAAVKPKAPPFVIPLWVWLPLLAGGFLVAIFRAFHDVRMEREGMRAQRDAARAEIERRFAALRYALAVGALGARITRNADGETWDVAPWITFTNSSDEPLWLSFEELVITIDGQRAGEGWGFLVDGAPVPPRSDASVECPCVRGAAVPWQEAVLHFTVSYGHPQGTLRHRAHQRYRLQDPEQFWGRDAQNVSLKANLTGTEVRDVDG